MLKRFSSGKFPGVSSSLGLILIFFSLGALAGTVIGCTLTSPTLGEELAPYIESNVFPASLGSAFYGAFFFMALVLLFSTSYLGVFLIPSAVLVKAYSMSCSIAAMYCSFGADGAMCALFSIGIPSALVIPCLLVCAMDSLYFSKELFFIRFYSAPCYRGNPQFLRHLSIALALTALAAVYNYFLLPKILSRLF